MKLRDKDCRLEGLGYNKYNKATHLPTGAIVEFANFVGKREIMRALERYVASLALSSQHGNCNQGK